MSFTAYHMTRDLPQERRCPDCNGWGDAPNGVITQRGIPICSRCDGTGLRDPEAGYAIEEPNV